MYTLELIDGPADGLVFEADTSEVLPRSLSVWREYSEDGSGLVVVDPTDEDSPVPGQEAEVETYRARFAEVYTSLVLPPTLRHYVYDHVREQVTAPV